MLRQNGLTSGFRLFKATEDMPQDALRAMGFLLGEIQMELVGA